MTVAELEKEAEEITAIDLEPPLEFKVFEPCKMEKHEDCAIKTSEYQCYCHCHNNGWDKEAENDDEGITYNKEETF